MIALKDVLALRKKINRKRPDFVRQEDNRFKRIKRKANWRKPKGIHSKMREKQKSRNVIIKPGYRNPKVVRGMLPNGLEPRWIHNMKELQNVNPQKQAAIIASVVGTKKRIEVLNEAEKKGIKIANIKDPTRYIARVKKEFEERKKKQQVKNEEKKDAKTPVKEEKLSGEKTEEHKKEERLEAEKIMIKK